jgi:acyl-CoA reductase-like NAD-dependent aldehyde dehydrogenase
VLTVAEIIEEAGAPASSVSILPDRRLGDRMVSGSPKLLSFTGSRPSAGG